MASALPLVQSVCEQLPWDSEHFRLLHVVRTRLTQSESQLVLQQKPSTAHTWVTQFPCDESQPPVSFVPVLHTSCAQPQFSSAEPLQLSSRPFPHVSLGAGWTFCTQVRVEFWHW